MEADERLKEVEEELKLLKAEVRNVLLDLREIVLARSNPLTRDFPLDGAEDRAEASEEEERIGVGASAPTPQQDSTKDQGAKNGHHQGYQDPSPGPRSPFKAEESRDVLWQGGPEGDMIAWLIKAIDALGLRRVEQLLNVYRLLKPLPPNVGKAIGYLQDLMRSADGTDRAWLDALRELEEITRTS